MGSDGGGVLLRIDPASAEILAEIVVGPGPSAIAVSDAGAWVAVGAALPRSSSLAGHFEAVPSLPGRRDPARRSGRGLRTAVDGSQLRSRHIGSIRGSGRDHRSRAHGVHASAARGRHVECNERTYSDALKSDVRGGGAGVARLDVDGLETLGITWDRALSVHESVAPNAGVLCVLRNGTWVGVGGAVKGLTEPMSDRWTLNSPHVWVFESAPTG